MKKRSFFLNSIAIPSLSFSLCSHAEYIKVLDAVQPAVTQSPHQDIFQEGTAIELTEDEVKELRKWIDNAHEALAKIQNHLRNKSQLVERRDALVAAIRDIVVKSGEKDNEVLTRIVLNRALKVAEICSKSTSPLVVESLITFLLESVTLAKDFYVSDKVYLEAMNNPSNPKPESSEKFGLIYAEMIMRLSDSFMNIEMEYLTKRAALGWLGHDLNSVRNLNRALVASEIVQIKDLLASGKYPPEAPRDIQTNLVANKTLNLISALKYEYRENFRMSLSKKLGTDFSNKKKIENNNYSQNNGSRPLEAAFVFTIHMEEKAMLRAESEKVRSNFERLYKRLVGEGFEFKEVIGVEIQSYFSMPYKNLYEKRYEINGHHLLIEDIATAEDVERALLQFSSKDIKTALGTVVMIPEQKSAPLEEDYFGVQSQLMAAVHDLAKSGYFINDKNILRSTILVFISAGYDFDENEFVKIKRLSNVSAITVRKGAVASDIKGALIQSKMVNL